MNSPGRKAGVRRLGFGKVALASGSFGELTGNKKILRSLTHQQDVDKICRTRFIFHAETSQLDQRSGMRCVRSDINDRKKSTRGRTLDLG